MWRTIWTLFKIPCKQGIVDSKTTSISLSIYKDNSRSSINKKPLTLR